MSREGGGGSSAHDPRAPGLVCWWRPRPPGVLSGVSQLHLGAELGPAVGPAEAVLADAEEALGEAQRGHQQGDAQEEQRPLAHAGLLLVQLQAQEVDAAAAREGAFGASWAGEARRAGGGRADASGRLPGPGTAERPGPAWALGARLGRRGTGSGTGVRCPVVLRPAQLLPVPPVLGEEPVQQRLEVVHHGGRRHVGLACDQLHGFRPRLTEAQFHGIPGGSTKEGKLSQKDRRGGSLLQRPTSFSLPTPPHPRPPRASTSFRDWEGLGRPGGVGVGVGEG